MNFFDINILSAGRMKLELTHIETHELGLKHGNVLGPIRQIQTLALGFDMVGRLDCHVEELGTGEDQVATVAAAERFNRHVH
ncbi:MAG: hypothetical protein EA381_14105 [Planctomycetaceae bacterium]|nr:MAG: hypothetical protein EA381_14105 [Planctomycetaceae bacterium]